MMKMTATANGTIVDTLTCRAQHAEDYFHDLLVDNDANLLFWTDCQAFRDGTMDRRAWSGRHGDLVAFDTLP